MFTRWRCYLGARAHAHTARSRQREVAPAPAEIARPAREEPTTGLQLAAQRMTRLGGRLALDLPKISLVLLIQLRSTCADVAIAREHL